MLKKRSNQSVALNNKVWGPWLHYFNSKPGVKQVMWSYFKKKKMDNINFCWKRQELALLLIFLFTHHLNVDSCVQRHPTSSPIIDVGEDVTWTLVVLGHSASQSAPFSALYCSLHVLYSLDWNLLLFSFGKSSIKQTYRYRTLRWTRGSHGTLYCREMTKSVIRSVTASWHTENFL